MALSPAEIEQATLLAWPALEEAADGGWTARFAHGYTKRANSVHCLDPADDGRAQQRITALAELYRARDLRPVFRVTPLAGPGIVAALDEMGWDVYEPSLVLGMELSKRQRLVSALTKYFEPSDPEWRQVQADLAGYSAQTRNVLGQILDRITVPACGIVVYDDSYQPAGAALAVNAQNCAVLLNVVVDPAKRGEGFGRAVMHAGLNWTSQMGASYAAIQVLANNKVALGLYRSLGFEQIYEYHYRRAPQ
ncbi:GNAT family N-acetyltransferase [Devosia submarina]|uniref:GNAT family N-acetyltransferase n=1 Tax=Devosia submarina TaxID=1173082 RepID=UPI0013002186|nr:GNAT family N-acetyltransferase [Devosia submarina]